MAQETTRVGKLDFNDIKTSLKTYLSQQTEFTDYNFEGSGLSQLINVLAYNAHYDALIANFMANEVFLDTATKRSSVVSRAKELGYTPRSKRASFTDITMSLKNIANEGDISSVVLTSGSRFSTTVNDTTFTFTTKEAVPLNKIIELGSPVFRNTIRVYEGLLVQHVTKYNAVDKTMSIPNIDIDTTTLKVEVYENGSYVEYIQPQNFLTLSATTPAYMIQEGFSGFEIYFGDGVIGKAPADGSNVRMTYVATTGDGANGAMNFTLSSIVAGMISNTIVTLTPAYASTGGQIEEQLDSIKLNAKNLYGSQNRAVIADDYASLALQSFPNIKDVIAWDGAQNDPPKFGRTILCAQPMFGDVLLPSEKADIKTYLDGKSVGNVKVEFSDPEYINLEIYSKVKYNISNLTASTYELKFDVIAALLAHASSTIQKFKGDARYSTLVSLIDNSNSAITGNETTVGLSKVIKVNLHTGNSNIISFMNSIKKGTVQSTNFYDGQSSNILYLKDNNGVIHTYYSNNGVDTLYAANVGSVDYVTGKVVISNLLISSIIGDKFKITATPDSLDIYSSKNIILKLNQENITIEVIKDNT